MEDAYPDGLRSFCGALEISGEKRLLARNLQDEILEPGERIVSIDDPGISFLIVELCRDGEAESVGLITDVELRPTPRFHQRFREVLKRLRVVLEGDEKLGKEVPATRPTAPHEGQPLHLREKLAML